MRLTTIKVGMDWLGDYSVRTNYGNMAMTSDTVEIWAGILGLAYLAALGLYFEMLSARKRGHVAASYGLGRHARSQTVKRRQ